MKTLANARARWPVLLLAVAICGFACRCVLAESPSPADRPQVDEELRCEILYRRDVDQSVRMALIASGAFSDQSSAVQLEEAAKRLNDIDGRNTERMKQIVTQYGWPGKSLVGETGAGAAWLLVQHSGDLPFMEQCLALMEAAAEKGEVSRKDLATLADRVRWRQGKPQIYGTQFVQGSGGGYVPHTIEDEAHVDERRKSVGLPPMAEQEKMLQTLYSTKAISGQ